MHDHFEGVTYFTINRSKEDLFESVVIKVRRDRGNVVEIEETWLI